MGVFVKIPTGDGVDKTLKIEFSHEPYSEIRGQVLTKKRKFKTVVLPNPRACECRICEIVESTVEGEAVNIKRVLSVGQSVCSPDDVYVKSEGRVYAFARALWESGFDEEWTNILALAYVTRTGTENSLEYLQLLRATLGLQIAQIDDQIADELAQTAFESYIAKDALKQAKLKEYKESKNSL